MCYNVNYARVTWYILAYVRVDRVVLDHSNLYSCKECSSGMFWASLEYIILEKLGPLLMGLDVVSLGSCHSFIGSQYKGI